MVRTAFTVSTLSDWVPSRRGGEKELENADSNESGRYRPQSANHRLKHKVRLQNIQPGIRKDDRQDSIQIIARHQQLTMRTQDKEKRLCRNFQVVR